MVIRRPVWRQLLLLVTVLAALVASPASLSAVEVEVKETAVRRAVLALFDSRAEGALHETRLHRFAEMPLNWLGYVVDYHDVAKPLPEQGQLQRYRGIVTWFLEPLANAGTVGTFIEKAVNSGIKHVVLGEALPGAQPSDSSLVMRLHDALGLVYTGGYVDVTFRSRISAKNDAMIGFERPVDVVLPDFPRLTAIPGRSAVHLAIETRNRSRTDTTAIGVTGAKGGYAAQGFTIYYEPVTNRTLWVLNPFLFFRQSLGDQRFPIPDVTTLSGRRLYFSHIDGDGWNNVSEVEGYREAQVLSSEVIAKEAIEPYPDLPVSVALISGDVVPLLGGRASGIKVARQLFALPQVEVASHTHTHPFNWQFYERYDRAAEERKVDAFQRPTRPVLDRIAGNMLELSGRRAAVDQFDKYVAGSDDLPRTYLRLPFSIEAEIAGSLKIIEGLAPPGKRAMLYQWSGDTTPFEGAVAATRLAGVRNMNGGDSRLDRAFPSVAYVPPIGRAIGAERQIYAGNSNENTYTNDWTGPYYGFFLLGQTLDNTDAPRRLKPFNLYYHMYSGEKPSALAAIKHFLDRARRSPLVPVAASDYAAIAEAFYQVQIEQIDLFAWAITQRGQLQTVRFDDADSLTVDTANSQSVLGYTRHQGSLYISLDAADERAVVALMPRGDANRAPPDKGPDLILVESRWRLSKRAVDGCAQTIAAQGFGPSEMTWRTRPMRSFKIVAERNGRDLLSTVVAASADGLLRFSLDLDARQPLTLRLTCDE